MLHVSESWLFTKTNLQRVQHNDRAMIRQTCSIKPEEGHASRFAKLELENIDIEGFAGLDMWSSQNSI